MMVFWIEKSTGTEKNIYGNVNMLKNVSGKCEKDPMSSDFFMNLQIQKELTKNKNEKKI